MGRPAFRHLYPNLICLIIQSIQSSYVADLSRCLSQMQLELSLAETSTFYCVKYQFRNLCLKKKTQENDIGEITRRNASAVFVDCSIGTTFCVLKNMLT